MTDAVEEKPSVDSLGDDSKMDATVSGGDTPQNSNSATTKNYKTTLCQYYLQGPCKNGENCSYAHGTSELRTMSGHPVSELKESSAANGSTPFKTVNRFKTTLCAKFVTIGSCPFGPACNFAHGVQELRQAAESAVQREHNHNANYKTSLCKNFTQGVYCSFAEKCQYAHGKAELREKPSPVPPSLMSEEDKKKRIEKAKKMPGYKTKVCQNYERNNECEYGEICHYAHGNDEIREAAPEEKESFQAGNPFYKTAMCKNLKKGECPHGDQCVYAHAESELRPMPQNLFKTTLCKNFMEFGHCNFGMSCQFAHGQLDLRRGDGSAYSDPRSVGFLQCPLGGKEMAFNNSKYKTQMCQQVLMHGFCRRGANCSFAHSQLEKRLSAPRQFGMIQKPGQPAKYKTTMCTSVMEANGSCMRGEECNFAHSIAELKAGQAADPKFKTELCSNYCTNGYCERQNNCKFAHGQSELRPLKSLNGSNPIQATYGKINNSSSGMNIMSGGGGRFAKQDNYKTTMCRHAVNGVCQRGEACNFAHSANELRSKIAQQQQQQQQQQAAHMFTSNNPNGMFDTGAMAQSQMDQYSGGAGPSYSNDGYGTNGKRKKIAPGGGMKTVLCQNFATFGQCQYGDACLYAHGENEMTVNKRQRF